MSFSKLKFPPKVEKHEKKNLKKKNISALIQKLDFGFGFRYKNPGYVIERHFMEQVLLQSLNYLMNDWPHQPYINGSDGPGRWLRSVTG